MGKLLQITSPMNVQTHSCFTSGPEIQAQLWKDPPSIGPLPPEASMATMGLESAEGLCMAV